MDDLIKGATVSRQTVTPGTALCGIDNLPDEVLIEIFSYLRLCDLTWCSHTCSRWRAILREEKSLWRRWQCATYDVGNAREVLATAGAVPQLETLYLLYSGSFGIHVAWPEATVFHHYGDAPLTWEPYFRCFDTDCLVIDHSMQKNIFFYLSWVDRLTLRRIFVVEQSYFCNPSDRTCESAGPVREAGSVDGPIRRVRDAHRDLFSGKGRRRGSALEVSAATSGVDAAVCPALEEVNVFSKYIWDEHLERLCSLGPVRALHVRCQRLRSLTFVRGCSATLEELEVSDCRRLLEDAFADLRYLERLRVLRLSDCHVEAQTVCSCVAGLPHLESCTINGCEVIWDLSS
ncbi:uncharacterized protein LOC126294975 [Schistocerca gregaria]|uniref:uncharacterized protein LOC126294975 n=1 Tax=Schistocerca gregaria TaxID=7010 RepID=UPI00211DD697|nr:uncharacterized protein LOC126294975 [Schistocerca gregaria]XP_049843160.1 uncharacterized protein LOC126294975 [Schistocerca gregaria]XP_049843161.1 uncharacterized protein LOC126294975 [Schistocerca gregaria]